MLKTALFLDFDNAFSLVGTAGQVAAKRFGHDPARWLKRLEDGPGGPRRILLRRAWLNPDLYGGFRGALVRAGFTVSDCPALTRNGKNAADIAMALEIVDALADPARFDEFLILSGDADFAPVLIRLRAHDRRTAILGAGAVAALRGAADRVLSIADLVDMPDRAAAPAAGPSNPARERALDVIEAMLAKAGRPVHGSVVGVGLRSLFGAEIEATKWFGAGSLAGLVRTAGRPGLAMDKGRGADHIRDPRRQTAAPPDQPAAPAPVTMAEPDPALADLIDRLAGVGFPSLTAARVAAVLDEAARQIAAGVVERNPLGIAVRDAMRATAPVSRPQVQFLLNGISLAGGVFGETCRSADELRLFLCKSLWTYHEDRIGPLSAGDAALLHRLVGLKAPPLTD